MKIIPVKTRYITPNEGYDILIENISKICEDNDYVFISETPISIAENSLIDEAKYNTGIKAYLLTEIWSKCLWGYVLCPLLGYKERTIENLRRMPKEARKHKQFILEEYGLKHALQPTAEAGVDLSNVPDSYVSLLPKNPQKTALLIKNEILKKSNKNVDIIIIDTDATYELHGIKFTSLPKAANGIKKDMGIFGYILGNFSNKLGPTVLASTVKCDIDKLIKLAALTEQSQIDNSSSFFETIYDMHYAFKKGYDEISIESLKSITHIPAVIIRENKYLSE